METKTRTFGLGIGLLIGFFFGSGTGIVGSLFGGIPGFWVFFIGGGILGWYISADIAQLFRKIFRRN